MLRVVGSKLRTQSSAAIPCVLRVASSKSAEVHDGWLHTMALSHQHSSLKSQPIQKAVFSSSAAAAAVPKLDFQATPLSSQADISLLDDDASSQIAPKNSRKKRQQKKKKSQSSNNSHVSSIPKQSSYTTRILFDSIAPHIEFRTLLQLTKQLSNLISRGHHKLDVSDKNIMKRTIKRRLNTLFEPDSSDGASGEYSWSIKSHRWIQPVIYQYIMGKHLDATQSKRKPATSATTNNQPLSANEDPTYPPNQNRKNYQQNIQTMMKARQVSLRHPIFWTEKLMKESGYSYSGNKAQQRDPQRLKYQQEISRLHSLKDEEQLQDDAEHLLHLLMDCLPPPHFDKVMKSLEDYAKLDDDNVTESSVNSWCIDEDNSERNSFSKTSRNESVKGRRIPILGKFLGASSSSHSHLVAVELGQFLYVKLPSLGKEESDDKEGNNVENDSSLEESEITASEAAHALRKHRKLQSSDKRYQKTKEDFVKKMMELQHDFASWDEKSVQTSSMSESSNSGTGASDGDDSDTDDSTDLQVTEFERHQQSYNINTRKMQKEELAETLAELRRMGLRTEEDSLSANGGRGRPRKGIHLRFTGVRKEDSSVDSPVSNDAPADESDLEQRLVFVNNLPIDTTEEEIDQIYSRCGALDSIKLFNLRPDLDPGPLTKAQLAERRRNSRMKNKYSNGLSFQQQQRPRTPVYGMLTFKDAEGFKTATGPELSIFGCVIRRHPVMSIKPQNLSTLYLENIPQNLYSMDVEYKLARCLHPHQVYVMLDGMKGVGKDVENNQDYSEPASCEIKFEDFHTAMQAYNWIRAGADGTVGEGSNVTLLGGEDCRLHWFRTPHDGVKYWTRELNF